MFPNVRFLLHMKLFLSSLLELFATAGEINETYIENLTQEDIIQNVNNVDRSGIFLIEKDFKRFLGDIERNSTGHIIGAKATYINWFSEANLTAAFQQKQSDPSRQGMGLDENVSDKSFLSILLDSHKIVLDLSTMRSRTNRLFAGL